MADDKLKKLNQIEATIRAKYPKMDASTKEAVTQILNQKRAELLSGAGVSPQDVPTNPLGQQILEQQVQSGNYQKPLTAAQEALQANKLEADKKVAELENMLFGVQSGKPQYASDIPLVNRAQGGASQIAAQMGFNPELNTYINSLAAITPFLVKASGQGANMSDKEQKAAVKQIQESYGYSKKEATMAFEALRKVYGLPSRTIPQAGQPAVEDYLNKYFPK
jgi:hypothetical protein